MKDGDVLLTPLLQHDGTIKVRPVVRLRPMPPFQDILVCGISSKLEQAVPDFDEYLTPADPDFRTSGLKASSIIRLGFLASLPANLVKGRIGSISSARLKRLLANLCKHLQS
jgi:mRNA interferase MazF